MYPQTDLGRVENGETKGEEGGGQKQASTEGNQAEKGRKGDSPAARHGTLAPFTPQSLPSSQLYAPRNVPS